MLPENWEAVQLFWRCRTQWRRAGLTGIPTGLDYPAVESVMRMTGIEDTAGTLQKLQLVELGALEAMQEQQDQE